MSEDEEIILKADESEEEDVPDETKVFCSIHSTFDPECPKCKEARKNSGSRKHTCKCGNTVRYPIPFCSKCNKKHTWAGLDTKYKEDRRAEIGKRMKMVNQEPILSNNKRDLYMKKKTLIKLTTSILNRVRDIPQRQRNIFGDSLASDDSDLITLLDGIHGAVQESAPKQITPALQLANNNLKIYLQTILFTLKSVDDPQLDNLITVDFYDGIAPKRSTMEDLLAVIVDFIEDSL